MRLAIVFILFCTAASAGPWLRAPGQQFLSLSVEADLKGDRAEALGLAYYELGLTPNITLGIDAGADSWGQSSTLAFARFPLLRSDTGHVIATEIALGPYTGTTVSDWVIRPGLSWGRGLDFWQGGWIMVDAQYAYLIETGLGRSKLETTLGLNHGNRIKSLLQITVEKTDGVDITVSVTPGLAWRISEQIQLVGGVIWRSDSSSALKLGLWREY
ncbi:hypothetical protein [uncultured Shimia sp.]|uniref:hypothetical protein n=1 Tax=uncultured Shimia sp. TaxID=573152 RepID=UPI00262113F6|nr:hypothetical protein [uncultured Shimia sp.]